MNSFFRELILPQINQLFMKIDKNIKYPNNIAEYKYICQSDFGNGTLKCYCFKDLFMLMSYNITLRKDIKVKFSYPSYYAICESNNNVNKYIYPYYLNNKKILSYYSPKGSFNRLIKKELQFQSFSVLFSEKFINDLGISKTILSKSCFNGNSINSPYIKSLLEQIFKTNAETPYAFLYYQGKIMELISLIIQYNKNLSLNKSVLTKCDENLLIDIIDYLDSNYSNPIDIQSLERLFFISRSKLSQIFKAKYNMSLTEYLKNIRLGHAKNMLEKTSLSILEISKLVGYTNQGSFSEFFKSQTGFTPSQYRQEVLKFAISF